jgi:hypothetical protein
MNVTITRVSDNTTLSISGPVTVSEADVLTPQQNQPAINIDPNQPFSGTVATFTDTNTSNVAGDFTAVIDWGDGTPTTTGSVTGSNGSFTVSGTHTYTTAGQDNIKVTITDDASGTAVATATSTAFVGAILTGAGAQLSVPEATPLSNNTIVASFTDSNPLDMAAGFTAMINWGDGVTTSGTVNGSNGSFTVTGTHTYADEGTDPLSVVITRTADNSTTTFTGNATVTEADVLTAQGTTLVINPNTWVGTLTAHFSDTDTRNVAGDFNATINWGDGTPATAGTLTDVGGAITVSGSHTYAAASQFPVTVTLTDNTPGTAFATARTTANVDQDTSKDPAPAFTITSHSISVSPGQSVSLPITVSGFDPDDAVVVKIGNIPSWLTITDKLDGHTFGPGSATLTAQEVNSTLMAVSTYEGSGQPVAMLTFTAMNTTTGETSTSTTQSIKVTDPPVTLSNTDKAVALLTQYMASGFHEHNGALITTSGPSIQEHESLFLATPHHG